MKPAIAHRWLGAGLALLIPAAVVAQVATFEPGATLRASDLQALADAVAELQVRVNSTLIGEPVRLTPANVGAPVDLSIADRGPRTFTANDGAGILTISPTGSSLAVITSRAYAGGSASGSRLANQRDGDAAPVFVAAGATVTVEATELGPGTAAENTNQLRFFWQSLGGPGGLPTVGVP